MVTGIVQEFQFGMNWSDYSRFVGDVFGAPLAIEGLLAFFLESTFLGLWIFGWDKLPRALHAACMWIVHLGTLFSSWFILAANSWMQHPVGHTYNPETGRAELIDFWAVMFNKVQLVTFPHVIASAYLTAGAFVVGVAGWLYVRRGHEPDRGLYRRAVRIGAAVTLLAGLGVAVSGDIQGKIMTEVQPMKMAAAEGLFETEKPRVVLGLHHRHPRRDRGEVRDQDPRPAVASSAPARSTARSRASTTCARSTPRRTARTPARPTTPPATTCRSSR